MISKIYGMFRFAIGLFSDGCWLSLRIALTYVRSRETMSSGIYMLHGCCYNRETNTDANALHVRVDVVGQLFPVLRRYAVVAAHANRLANAQEAGPTPDVCVQDTHAMLHRHMSLTLRIANCFVCACILHNGVRQFRIIGCVRVCACLVVCVCVSVSVSVCLSVGAGVFAYFCICVWVFRLFD